MRRIIEYRGYEIDFDEDRYSVDLNGNVYPDPIKVYMPSSEINCRWDLFHGTEIESTQKAMDLIDPIAEHDEKFLDHVPQFKAEVKCTVTKIEDWR